MLQRQAEERDHFVPVLGSGDRHPRDAEHVRDVEHAVVRRTVGTRYPRAVHAEDDRKLLQRHVVDDRVERPLQKGGVDRDHRANPLCRQPGREGDRMPFGDSHVEEAVGVSVLEDLGAGATGHRRRDRHHLRPLGGELGERLAEHLGV